MRNNLVLDRACYNTRGLKKPIKKALKAARRDRAAVAAPAAAKPAAQNESAKILGIGQARGCETLAQRWLANKMGDAAAFVQMLAARYQRKQRLGV